VQTAASGRAPAADQSKPDIGCQRQRLSFIGRGVCAGLSLQENSAFSEGWPGGRSEQAKLTACRKVSRMYRRESPKSRQKTSEKSRFRGLLSTPPAATSTPGGKIGESRFTAR
jgi:hypothetical protein